MGYQYRKQELNKWDQLVYDRLLLDMLEAKDHIYVSPVFAPTLDNIFKAILEDHPEIFYVKSYSGILYPIGARITPEYLYSQDEIRHLQRICQERRKWVMENRIVTGELQTVRRVHDVLSYNIQYQETGPEAHSILGPVVKGIGVCEGFAKAMKYILDAYDIPCILICGYARPSDGSPEEAHCWNLVQIQGRWRHVDLTFDNTIAPGRQLRYDYYLLNDLQISKDHRWELDKYPRAD